jgi:serine/threonine-protein kinase
VLTIETKKQKHHIMAGNDKIYDLFKIGQRLNLPFLTNPKDCAPSYYVVKDILRGGMGGCIRINGRDGKDYALKIILPELFSSEISVKRYIQELSKWRTFSMCDGILETFGIFDYEDIPCIVSPWLDKGELSCLMHIKERTVFYNTMHRIIGALDWVYTNYHTIHRDIKPGNILVDKDYLPYIADWGLAKTINIPEDYINSSHNISSNADLNLTQANYVVCTKPYASPEQLSGSRELDCRSDMFALGIIMYMWETDVYPFSHRSDDELVYNICHGRFNKLGSLFRRSNFGAEKIINKCLALSPEDRFSNYSELLDAIEKEGRNVPSFHKYQPKLRYYSDLESPDNLCER